jgi:hypothetical protein
MAFSLLHLSTGGFLTPESERFAFRLQNTVIRSSLGGVGRLPGGVRIPMLEKKLEKKRENKSGLAETSPHYYARSLLAFALGAAAVGAMAIGALAIGRLAIGRLEIGKARFKSLEVDELTVRKLHVTEDDSAPP